MTEDFKAQVRNAREERAMGNELRSQDDTCRPIDVDGETIRVHGAAEMTEEDRGHFAEIVRAAKRRLEDECQKPHLSGHDAATIQRALEALPKTCKYHGDKLERNGSAWTDSSCCDTGKPSLLRRKAEVALAHARSKETSA
jgi:hypothetical protein